MAGLDSFHLVKRTLYCGGPATEAHRWLYARHSAADLSNSWPQLRDRVVIGTYRGRSAVALACQLLRIGPEHEVLVPAYNCGTELDAVMSSGAHMVGYQVSRRCAIDLEDLMARKSSRTRAVYLIHYFGWEQPMEELRRWCDREGLLLIEDCALALFSAGSSGAIGRTGHAAIFSLPKTLGSVHGGLLSMSLPHTVDLPRLAKAGLLVFLKEVQISAKTRAFYVLERLGLYGALLAVRQQFRVERHLRDAGDAFPRMPADYCFSPSTDANRALHPRAFALATSVSWEEVVRRRRANYLRLTKAINGIKGVELLYHQLPERVCPLALPLLVSNRDACVTALQARGIGAFPWWAGFHPRAMEWSQFKDACWLKHNLLTLPVHQDLDHQHLDYLIETAVQVLQSPRGRPKTDRATVFRSRSTVSGSGRRI